MQLLATLVFDTVITCGEALSLWHEITITLIFSLFNLIYYLSILFIFMFFSQSNPHLRYFIYENFHLNCEIFFLKNSFLNYNLSLLNLDL